jgi:hypothetical protein
VNRFCPLCRADLRGAPIDPAYRDKWYGGETHYSRRITIVGQKADAAIRYKCPSCEGEWPANTPPGTNK